jgi:hypothetical protein
MSKVDSVAKTVKIKESHLVDLIDNIVNEAVAVKKQEWINEQAKKSNEKTSVLESKLTALEEKINLLTANK